MTNVRNMMLEDSKDLLDNVEVTTIAQECVKLKNKEDEIAQIEEQRPINGFGTISWRILLKIMSL